MALRPAVVVAWIWFGCLALSGGTGQNHDIRNVILESLATILLAFYAWRTPEIFRPRGIMLFGYMAAGLLVLQLLPLPFAVWRSMPGHQIYVEALHSAGIVDRARPWSVTPDLTLAALTGLLPLIATAAMLQTLDARERRGLVVPLAILFLLGTLLGMIQMAQGAESALRIYPAGTEDGPVGFFSNRNHHALSMAIGISFSIVAAQAVFPLRRSTHVVLGLCLSIVALLLVAILVAGSRGALLVAAPSLLFLAVPVRSTMEQLPAKRRHWFVIAALVVLIGVGGLGAFTLIQSNRALSLLRLWNMASQDELRWNAIPTILQLAWAYFPFGSGFGTFDTVFRTAEPMRLLRYTFLNEAHNEPLQILLEGGLPGVALMVTALVAVVLAVVKARGGTGESRLFALLGLVTLVQLGLISLADYPLRTALLASVGLTAYCWIRDASAARSSSEGTVA